MKAFNKKKKPKHEVKCKYFIDWKPYLNTKKTVVKKYGVLIKFEIRV